MPQRSVAGLLLAYQVFARCNIASLLWFALEWRDIVPSAQTERRERCRAGEGLT
jgi:hypothetical protein